VLCDDFGHALSEIPGDTDTYFVIVTRGHRYDRECLEQILGKKHAYIGMMGSRRRGILLKKQLAEAGYKEALLEQVHTPIGLSIGAETPEEIAVSILAELIQVKNTERKISTYDLALLTYLTENSKDREAGVLCTIVSKRGSAPRECGTKMLLLQSGAILGTIGGGCAESSIMEKGRMLLQGLLPSPRLEQVDMTAEQAEEEGMVCGGTILVYMELVNPM
jgi:xanthine dehydrogenase accessory factor